MRRGCISGILSKNFWGDVQSGNPGFLLAGVGCLGVPDIGWGGGCPGGLFGPGRPRLYSAMGGIPGDSAGGAGARSGARARGGARAWGGDRARCRARAGLTGALEFLILLLDLFATDVLESHALCVRAYVHASVHGSSVCVTTANLSHCDQCRFMGPRVVVSDVFKKLSVTARDMLSVSILSDIFKSLNLSQLGPIRE